MSLNKVQESAIEKLKAQQAKTDEDSPVYVVAEQLMDICRNEPQSAELIDKDLDNPEMSIKRAEGKIKAFVDEIHKKKGGNIVALSLAKAEKILREFYGLPERGESRDLKPASDDDEKPLDLMDFLRG